MKELVSFIATSLVDQPGAVEVNETAEEEEILVELRVAKDDLGKIIGKQGRTARAIRSLLSVAAAKQDRKVRLEIVE